jgi:flagellar basal-body rod protein FlgG
MMRALWTASSGMIAQQSNVDVIANNLANVNTTAFKKQRLEFKDLLYETVSKPSVAQDGSGTPVGLQIGHGVRQIATQRNFTSGSWEETGNPYDVAINGPGFLTIKLGDNNIKYTKDGSLKLSSVQSDGTRRLVTSTGDDVLSVDGNVIDVAPSIKDVTIGKDGAVTYQDENNVTQTLGQISIVRFANPAGLEASGDNYFTATGASGTPIAESTLADGDKSIVVSGSLESSNVQVVEEMVKLITAQRAYEINSKSISTADEMLSQVNNLKR